MSNHKILLRTAMTVASYQAIGRGPTEELKDALNQDLILRFRMKEEENENDTVVATQEPPTAAQDDLEATAQSFPNAK